MEISPIFFYLFSGLAIAFALMTVLKKNPVTSAFSLVMVFFCFAGIYAMLGAHLVAALQILVYAGAIMVLFIFVIMLVNADIPSLDLARSSLFLKFVAGALSLVLLASLVWVFHGFKQVIPAGPFTVAAIEKAGGNTQVVSEMLFSSYLLPFELTSILLLAAIIGAVALAKRQAPKSKLAIDRGVKR